MPDRETAALPGQPPGMNLVPHLREMRRRLIISLICFGLGMVAAWNLGPEIYEILIGPLRQALPEEQPLMALKLPDGFLIRMRISFFGGIILAVPMMIYQVWAFAAPGLLPREQKLAWPLVSLALFLFLAGMAAAYFLALPLAFKFLAGFFGGELALLPAARENLALVTSSLIAFGLAFELPLGLLVLNRLGVVSLAGLKKWRGGAVLAIFIVAAVITPPDVASQIMLAGPLILLYELSLALIRLVGKS